GRRVALATHTVLVARANTERAIEDTAAPIFDGSAIVGVVLVFHDVTARREARRKLEEAHKRTEQILASMSDGFAIFDEQWRYVYVNAPAAEINRRQMQD